jgi:uncharacterized FAD-dependent dehydrogenase
MIESLYDSIANNSSIDLSLDTEAVHIEPVEHGYEVTARTVLGQVQLYRARSVIVAVGRKGYKWWHEEARKLGLTRTQPVPSVGLRFECPADFLNKASSLHPDFKTTYHEYGIKIKTFCFCAGVGGGQIKFTDYGDYTLLDGHVFPDGPGQIANFALLAQLRDEDHIPRSFEWVFENLLEPYKALRKDRPGKPVIQWYPDFKNRSMTCSSMEEFKIRSQFIPSLLDYEFANLADILPESIHAAFCVVFEKLIGYFLEISSPDLQSKHINPLNEVGVMGLELENLWDVITVNAGMESSLPNLYVCGDCNGIAQGILQSAVSGLAASERCVQKSKAENEVVYS